MELGNPLFGIDVKLCWLLAAGWAGWLLEQAGCKEFAFVPAAPETVSKCHSDLSLTCPVVLAVLPEFCTLRLYRVAAKK